MLPLSHRVLLRIKARPATARELSRALGVDHAGMHAVLNGLLEDGTLERSHGSKGPAVWRLAPGVQVDLRPATVVVTGATPQRARVWKRGQCTALNAKGFPCPLPAVWERLCFVHAPRPFGCQN